MNKKDLLSIFTVSDKNVTRKPGATELAGSKLHFEYSINGNPSLKDLPPPSRLDLDAKQPKYAYKDNLPSGARV